MWSKDEEDPKGALENVKESALLHKIRCKIKSPVSETCMFFLDGMERSTNIELAEARTKRPRNVGLPMFAPDR
jgi:hypothetical protein